MMVKRKLLFGFLSASAIILFAGILGIIQTHFIYSQSKNIGLVNAPLDDAVMEIQIATATAHLWFEEIISGVEEKTTIIKVWKLLDQSLWYCDAILKGGKDGKETFHPVNDPVIEQRISVIKQGLAELKQAAELRFQNQFGTQEFEEQILETQFDTLFDKLISLVDEAEKMIHAKMDADIDALDEIVDITMTIFILLILFSFMMAVLLGIKISDHISNPIQAAQAWAIQVAKGDFSQQIDEQYAKRHDEMGDLFNALGKMNHDLQRLITTLAKQKDDALRINQALDNVNTSVLITDNEYKIIYANQSAVDLFTEKEAVIRQDFPHFEAKHLLGYSIDQFHQHPAHQHQVLAQLTSTHQMTLKLGEVNLKVKINPVINAEGLSNGWVSEFYDRTAEVATEQEINAVIEAASKGDFNQRITLTDKTGFFKTFSESLNQTLDINQQMIEELIHVFAALARGDLTQTITKDYVGSLQQLKEDVNATIAKLTNVMNTIQAVAEAASKGDFTGRIDLHDKTGFFHTLSEILNHILVSNQDMIEDSKGVFAAIANGDLTQTMTKDYVGALEQLKQNVNTSVMALTQVVNTVQESAQVVNHAAQEISQGNSHLSQRTEEQAASLEETAASMEQMTGVIQQNADNAQQAKQLAESTRDQALVGGTVVEKAIEAMSKINKSSQKVADIISVINEIAFQTNLLALNAAVEAARAGEQGRAFAVVATEVRNLAQRSAVAAKEIKALIKDSVSKVKEGNELVNQSGTTLKEIVVAVKKVSDIIYEIAAAGQEQSAGIHQVNKTIAQMDDMTQQNAALVQQAAVASDALREQAKRLQEQVAFFKTGEDALSSSSQ